MSLPDVVFVLGGPGAGKGTQCARIVKEYGYVHLSAGDLLRAERSKGGALGNMISDYIKEGKIIPVEITIRLIKQAMDENVAAGRSKFLIDGFPRNEDNLDGWNKMMTGQVNFKFVLFMDCSAEIMEKRLLGRNEGRADDNIESIRKRFKTYVDSTMPIIQRFEKDSAVRRIDAAKDPDAVWADVSALFKDAAPAPAPTAKAETKTQPASTTDAIDPVKKTFNSTLRQKVRNLSLGDAEAGSAASAKAKPKQFWELALPKQEELLLQAVQEAVFNPSIEQEDVMDVKWKVSKAVFTSISGGYHVNATERKTTGTVLEHHCRINAYGVLERYSTPSRPNLERDAADTGGCVVC